jgi:hypothetical protein
MRNISSEHGAYIKSDSSILDTMLLGRLKDRGLFIKITSHSEGGIFPKIYK